MAPSCSADYAAPLPSSPLTGLSSRSQARSGVRAGGCTAVGEQISAAISRRHRMRSAVRADPATTMAPVVVATRMPPAACGRTCDRPDGRSSTTADRPADDCAAHRAASRRALCERIRQRDCRCQHQEKQQPSNPMHRALLKTLDFLRSALHSSQDENEIRHNALPSTSCEAAGSCSPGY
jgi:hypothetical protein